MPKKKINHAIENCQALKAMFDIFASDLIGLHNFGHSLLEGKPVIFSYDGRILVYDRQEKTTEETGVILMLISLPTSVMKDIHSKLCGIAEIELEKKFGPAWFRQ